MKVVQNGHVKYRIEVCGCWCIYTNDRHKPVMRGYCEEHDPDAIKGLKELQDSMKPEPEVVPEPEAPAVESAEVEAEVRAEVAEEDTVAATADADAANAQPEGDEEAFDILKPAYPTLENEPETP